GLRDRHHHVDLARPGLAGDRLGEVLAHAQPRVVDRYAVDQRVGPGEVHVLEDAGIERRRLRALAALEVAVEVDEDRLARLHVANEPETGALERYRLGGDHVFGSGVGFRDAVAQRTDAVGIAEAQDAVARDLGDHRVRA